MENKLQIIIKESGLEKTKAQILLDNFSNYFDLAADWENKTKSLVVTDISQIAEMKMAREGRLFLRSKRIDVEKTRKQLKENALREGQTIDAIAKVLTNLIIPIENELEQKEKFAEYEREKELQLLKEKRAKELELYVEFVPIVDLKLISEEGYQKLYNGAKLQYEQKKAEEERIEKERLEKERLDDLEYNRRIAVAPFAQFITKSNDLRSMSDADFNKLIQSLEAAKKAYEKEQEEIRQENIRLAKEREAIEAKAKKEKQEAEEKLQEQIKKANEEAEKQRKITDAELKAEREAREKIEHEAQLKRELEVKAQKEKEEKELAEKKAPDKIKLIALAKTVTEIQLPELKTKEAAHIIDNVKGLISKLSKYIIDESDKL